MGLIWWFWAASGCGILGGDFGLDFLHVCVVLLAVVVVC